MKLIEYGANVCQGMLLNATKVQRDVAKCHEYGGGLE